MGPKGNRAASGFIKDKFGKDRVLEDTNKVNLEEDYLMDVVKRCNLSRHCKC
jgi:hypothetical protein